jgi:1,4-dihydroxy-2-naphthoate octaprenyltransferase
MRIHWTTTSTMPCLLGAAIAWKHGAFDLLIATLVLAAVWIAHVAMELWDDLCDFRGFRAEMYQGEEHTPHTRFSGGSGMLTSAQVQARDIERLLWILGVVYVPTVAFVLTKTGPEMLIFLAFGLLWAVGYGMPPLRLSARGLGELGLLVCFGPLIGIGTYLTLVLATVGSQGIHISGELIAVTSIAGVLNFAMIHVTEILDHDEDIASGKRTLVVRFGAGYGAIAQLCAMVVCVWLVYLASVDEPSYLLALVPLTYGLVQAHWFLNHYHCRQRLADRIKSFPHYRVHGFTCLTLIAAATPIFEGGSAATWFAAATVLSAAPGLSVYVPVVNHA